MSAALADTAQNINASMVAVATGIAHTLLQPAPMSVVHWLSRYRIDVGKHGLVAPLLQLQQSLYLHTAGDARAEIEWLTLADLAALGATAEAPQSAAPAGADVVAGTTVVSITAAFIKAAAGEGGLKRVVARRFDKAVRELGAQLRLLARITELAQLSVGNTTEAGEGEADTKELQELLDLVSAPLELGVGAKSTYAKKARRALQLMGSQDEAMDSKEGPNDGNAEDAGGEQGRESKADDSGTAANQGLSAEGKDQQGAARNVTEGRSWGLDLDVAMARRAWVQTCRRYRWLQQRRLRKQQLRRQREMQKMKRSSDMRVQWAEERGEDDESEGEQAGETGEWRDESGGDTDAKEYEYAPQSDQHRQQQLQQQQHLRELSRLRRRQSLMLAVTSTGTVQGETGWYEYFVPENVPGEPHKKNRVMVAKFLVEHIPREQGASSVDAGDGKDEEVWKGPPTNGHQILI
eukprot:g2573.t1